MASHLVKEIAQRFESMEKLKWEGLNVEEVGIKAVAGGGEPGLHGQDSLLLHRNGKVSRSPFQAQSHRYVLRITLQPNCQMFLQQQQPGSWRALYESSTALLASSPYVFLGSCFDLSCLEYSSNQ